MVKQLFISLVVVLMLAMAFLVAPVSADTMTVNAGNGQTAIAGTAVTTLPSVSVKDAANNPVVGVPVIFAVATGGGTATGLTAITDSSGIATIGSWTLGMTAGSNTLTVTNTSMSGSPQTFTATGTAGTATQLAINAGNSQSALIGTAVTTPPSVIVKDANNNPVSGVSVTFAVASGGGSVSGGSATTGTNGIASAGGWTLGTTAGTNTLTVTSGSLTPVTFTATGTSSATAPTISTVDPATGINNGYVRSVIVTGTGFSTGTTVVRLVKSGQTNITMVNPVITTTTVTGDFPLNGVTAGTWDVVLIADGGSFTKSSAFTVVNASAVATVTAISPTSARANTSVSSTITGTGFGTSARMRLSRSGYNDILGSVSSVSSTSAVGIFDLTNQAPGTWNVCVLYDGTNRICGPTFTIDSAASTANGSIYFTSTPSSAVVLVDSVNKGNTPFTLYNVTPGSYVIKMQRASYLEWSERVTVTAGNQTTVAGKLTAVDSSTTVTTAPPVVVTTKTLPPTTVKSTKTVPTPWKDTATTAASPVEITVIIGALAAGALVLRRK
jgi:hypothetical protein